MILLDYNLSVIAIMSRLTTLQKAKKLIGCPEQLQPRKLSIQPYMKSNEKRRRETSFSSASRSMSNIKRDFSFCKSKSKLQNSMNANKSYLKQKKHSNSSFISAYNKESRYDKIMKLKVKPTLNNTRREERNKRSVLSNSVSSCGSREDKENKSRNKINRLDKIMQIKIAKPKVNSTLIHYEPRQGHKFSIAEKRQSAVKEWKQCQTRMKKVKQQQDKEERLWKVFERERELRLKLRREAEERSFREQRRKQKRFQGIVSKQVHKIQKERQLSKHKTQSFSSYLYPSY